MWKIKPPDLFHSPRWLPGGQLQTIYAAYCVPRPGVPLEREIWSAPDGDILFVDGVAPERENMPTVVFFQGLEGSSADFYSRAMAHALMLAGWRGLFVNFRGCGGGQNLQPRFYHAGDSAELHWVLAKVARLYPSPLFAVGVSLGGNVLLKALGEMGARGEKLLSGAVAVCAPVRLEVAGQALNRWNNFHYRRFFLTKLKHKARKKLRQFPGLFNGASLAAATSLAEFDHVVTVPVHGFRSTAHYWSESSALPWLPHIDVPTLLVNTLDDPFYPASALPQQAEVSDRVVLDYHPAGGHAAFVSGSWPGHIRWLPERILRFFSQLSVG